MKQNEGRAVMAAPDIKAIIFDCFGVLYRDNISMLYDLVPPDRVGELQDIVRATDHGFLDRSEYYEQIAAIADVPVDKVRDVESRQHERDDAMIQFTQTLKPQYRVGLLSNIDVGTMDKIFPPEQRAQLFDAAVASGEIGLVKPSVELFEAAAERLGVESSQCVMIDDLQKNVEGARAAGMRAILFVSQRQLEHDLRELLERDA